MDTSHDTHHGMRLVTLASPPTCGKTSVLRHVAVHLQNLGLRIGVVKLDCLTTNDAERYREVGLEHVAQGLSGSRCPDHFFAGNVPRLIEWGTGRKLDILFLESAGLCNRCSPHVRGALAICVLDHLGGVQLPSKVGPMLRSSDLVVATRGDLVSQAEREVFALEVKRHAPTARVMGVQGRTGQGTLELSRLVNNLAKPLPSDELRLRFSMPAAVCSYCLGETRLGDERQIGNLKLLELPA
jgi:Ni2+-binding GTPase involved in maturation of urease and hydrogenase